MWRTQHVHARVATSLPGGRSTSHSYAAPAQPLAPSGWSWPDPGSADASGILGFGADLEPETLVDAYRRGIFPWPHDDTPLPWFSPDPRAVIAVGGVRTSRSLRQRLRRSGWETTFDAAFEEVIEGCAEPRPGQGTWITPEMVVAYRRLHRLGWAHSMEVWDGEQLVGGLYGVQVGACFTGESMFHRVSDASKVALVDLAARMRDAGGEVVDAQLPTEHLSRMGAVDMPREEFLEGLESWRARDIRLPVERRPVDMLAPLLAVRPA